MGLDQYLSRKMYVKNWDHTPEDQKTRAVITVRGQVIDTAKLSYLEFDAMYWRKANAIHNWFVNNVQNHVDDCGTYYVSIEQLEELRDLCVEVLNRATVSDGQPVHNGTTYYPNGNVEPHFEEGRAILNGTEIESLLPTKGGFFFGPTAYDEWYLQDIEDTVKGLTELLEREDGDGEYYYHASW